jgi:three-Cys-motif partner protein
MRRIKIHTVEKLEYIRKYIEAYSIATKSLPARYYIDAFAGSGTCLLCSEKCTSKGGIRCLKCGKGRVIDGSAIISLKIKNTFNKYVFIELNDSCIKELMKVINDQKLDLPGKINFVKGDSNIWFKDIYKYISGYVGCLIFLDPEGPELQWETIKQLSKINKVDLLILYPYDMSLVRLTSAPEYKQMLDNFYGDEKWMELYSDPKNFDATRKRKVLLDFYINNLEKLGFGFVRYKQIRKRLREGKPLYHLVLASHRKVAAKIMDDIFNKELDGQERIKFSRAN